MLLLIGISDDDIGAIDDADVSDDELLSSEQPAMTPTVSTAPAAASVRR